MLPFYHWLIFGTVGGLNPYPDGISNNTTFSDLVLVAIQFFFSTECLRLLHSNRATGWHWMTGAIHLMPIFQWSHFSRFNIHSIIEFITIWGNLQWGWIRWIQWQQIDGAIGSIDTVWSTNNSKFIGYTFKKWCRWIQSHGHWTYNGDGDL